MKIVLKKRVSGVRGDEVRIINFDINDFNKRKNPKYGNIGNKMLYDLCKKYPNHNTADEIHAKIWLIGRSYAASVERRSKSNDRNINDDFYDYVIRELIKFNETEKFDDKLKIFERQKFNEKSLGGLLKLHKELTKFFRKVTGKEKRSLASKYLHFHNIIFPIYDSRANNSINSIVKGKTQKIEGDKNYSSFCQKILFLYNLIEKENGEPSTLREVDTYLIEKANDKGREGR